MSKNLFSSPENRAAYEIMWNNIVERGRAADENMAHARCMLDTKGKKHTLRIFNIYCFFHCNNVRTNAPHCYVILTLSVVL